jgi:RNA polymerase sigma-70 factor (ECF subfamily)
MEQNEDQSLTDRIRRGDVAALGAYLDQQKGRLSGLLRHLMGDHLRQVVEVDDLFQEVSKSAILALAKIPKEGLDVDQWLDRLARRRVVDAYRQHFGAAKRAQGRNQIFSQMEVVGENEAAQFEQMLIASITSPSLAVSRDWRMQRMQSAIEQLPAEQQHMIRLRYVDGISTAEIAEKLNKSDVAIRVALSRIVAGLQEVLVDRENR